MLIDDVPEVVLNVVRRLEQEESGDVAGDARGHTEPHNPPDVVAEWDGVGLDRVGDGVVEQVGDEDLEYEADERQDQGRQEDGPVGLHDRHGPAQPRQGAIRVEA